MVVYLNGKFLPSDRAKVSIFDRGFLYGDGVFETIGVFNGVPFQWDRHLARFRGGIDFLKLKLPIKDAELKASAGKVIKANRSFCPSMPLKKIGCESCPNDQ
jgi:branched-subunit amino acid aminotransferase/4-amino-4-deoxychorismate lyase